MLIHQLVFQHKWCILLENITVSDYSVIICLCQSRFGVCHRYHFWVNIVNGQHAWSPLLHTRVLDSEEVKDMLKLQTWARRRTIRISLQKYTYKVQMLRNYLGLKKQKVRQKRLHRKEEKHLMSRIHNQIRKSCSKISNAHNRISQFTLQGKMRA